jgi:hypothetical protein
VHDDLGGRTDRRSGCCQRCCQLVDHVDPRRGLPTAAVGGHSCCRTLRAQRNLGQLVDLFSSSSGVSKPQHCAVSGPACRLRCRRTALAPSNRPLRKLRAADRSNRVGSSPGAIPVLSQILAIRAIHEVPAAAAPMINTTFNIGITTARPRANSSSPPVTQRCSSSPASPSRQPSSASASCAAGYRRPPDQACILNPVLAVD